jgi:hypothetical protein
MFTVAQLNDMQTFVHGRKAQLVATVAAEKKEPMQGVP